MIIVKSETMFAERWLELDNVKTEEICECSTSKSGVSYIMKEHFAESGDSLKALLENSILQTIRKNCK